MMSKIESFQSVIESIAMRSPLAWIYLPIDENWSLMSSSAVLESEEVPPELEDDPDAGIPIFAKENNLRQVVPVTTLQDIVINALQQFPSASLNELFLAFEYYYKNDAFIVFENVGGS